MVKNHGVGLLDAADQLRFGAAPRAVTLCQIAQHLALRRKLVVQQVRDYDLIAMIHRQTFYSLRASVIASRLQFTGSSGLRCEVVILSAAKDLRCP